MKRILLMSDTHGINEAKIEEILKINDYDLAVHCGDYCTEIEWMKKHFDYFVNGNNDYYGSKELNEIHFKFNGLNFIVNHGHMFYDFSYETWLNNLHEHLIRFNGDILLFGHSHIYTEKKFNDDKCVFNPGSLFLPRDGFKSYMIIKIDNKKKISCLRKIIR
ncbi:phosphoesterase [Candidatus Malacoplasma girerdii]|uniref:Phosphoesterase n=1 Tax=Candidatus Malacoplasma girerdii TaxID=1318617 RepID=A0A097ST89_9BACT|nr:phosphoesterase [Candidatus Malacoplasma girerdii]ASJ89325.1 MAG: putative phosphoesterase [Candidatus Malacoplasma girerdii]